MSLTITQKSLYIVIYNATMIGRSIGKTINKNKLLSYKQALFLEVVILCKKMDNRTLTNKNIINSIEKLSKKHIISFGQSQKAINVILKNHCLLFEKNNIHSIKKELDCPLDSIVLKHLNIKSSLTKMNKTNYIKIQNDIQKNLKYKYKIDLDSIWDEQNINKIFIN